MASKNENNAESGEQQTQQCAIRSFYLRDLSFESPRPVEQVGDWIERPEITLHIDIDTRHVKDDDHEVVLELTVSARLAGSGETLYLIEVKQAGLFSIQGFSDEELDGMLHIYCANILYPYAREVVSGMVVRGGFPPLLLSPVNFEALYERRLKQRKVSIPGADQSAEIQ